MRGFTTVPTTRIMVMGIVGCQTKNCPTTLLRKDLAVRYKLFRRFGKDALLLTVLSFNVGQGVLLGHGGHPKSRLVRKLEAGNRDIYKEYISFRCWKGKPVRSIERRRKMEFLLLYEP